MLGMETGLRIFPLGSYWNDFEGSGIWLARL